MEADRARVSLGGVWVIKVLSSHVRCQPQSSPSSLQVTASHFQSRLRWGREARRPGGTVDRGARTRSGEGARGTPGSSRRLAGRSNSNLARERGPQHRPGYLGEPAPLTFLGSRCRLPGPCFTFWELAVATRSLFHFRFPLRQGQGTGRSEKGRKGGGAQGRGGAAAIAGPGGGERG